MKILLVTQYFWPESFRINDVVSGLRERGHEVGVLTGLPNYPAGRFMAGYGVFGPYREHHEGMEVVRVPLIPRGGGGGLRLALNYLSFAFFASALGPWRCKAGYDVLLVYEPSPITVGIPAIVLRWIRGTRIVFWVQDLWPESLVATGAVRSPCILRAIARLAGSIYRRCSAVLVQSRGFVEPIKALGIPESRIGYLPNSAEEFYRPMSVSEYVREDAELPRGFRVVFAGNLGAAQDFPTILAAAESTRARADLHWIIFGDGRMRAWIEEQVSLRGLSGTVHLMGSRPAQAMPGFLAAANVLLVTLRRDPAFALTLPSKVQSYLACGRPIVAGLDGEGARVVDEARAGVACRAEDPTALAAAVLRVYHASVDERHAMGVAARAYFEANFERGSLLDRLEQALDGSCMGRAE